ncbi:restriction endonuclease [Actinoplanes teichomyceticus]|uniref:Restriction endonuclease n=1 Tax=Actinoplanes teichomyceticus TaxID=1867 RepID=A0A561VFW5_ACTTI|nr:restriction endonuclease [Actinoplanes teichomyceticus]GIF15281.1 restriction endonuclease [Actinoplanes teichomyceticus]
MSDASWHHAPDLVERLVDTIPTLVKSKQQTIDFFRSAGVPDSILQKHQAALRADSSSVSKYGIARSVIQDLNAGGDRFLRERREIVRLVTQWEDFSLSWPNDQDKARGLVAAVRQIVGARDSFARMQRERDQERQARIRESERLVDQKRKRQAARTALRARIVELRGESNAQRRGVLIESILSDLCAVEGIQVREPFEIRNAGTVEEQIDGVVMADHHLYLVEVKWWNAPIDITPMSSHLLRLFRRPDVRGLFISNSGYTEPAVQACREVLSQKLMILAELNEIIFLLEGDRPLEEWIREKASIVLMEREPFRVVMNH